MIAIPDQGKGPNGYTLDDEGHFDCRQAVKTSLCVTVASMSAKTETRISLESNRTENSCDPSWNWRCRRLSPLSLNGV